MTKVKYLLALLAAATAALVAVVVLADARAAEKEKAMGLRLVMQELGRDMQAVTGAISREDWVMVAKLAPGIGRHAQPPAMEKMRIIKWVGKDAGQFRALDARVGQAADDMAAAASRGDGAETIRAFADVQQACLACHTQFRKPFVKHFYQRP